MKTFVPALLLASSILAAFDAPAQAPTLVKDIYPGASATATPRAAFDRLLGVSNGKVFLNASVYDPSMGLWVTDGTAAGTHQLLDIVAGSGADVDGTFYFSVGPPWGTSLWKSDGTAGGTVFVSRVGTDPLSNGGPSRLTSAGDRLYFLFDDGIHGFEPWTSDGTEAGTKLLKDVTPGPTGTFSAGSMSSVPLVDAGGLLFFACPAYSGPGCGVWRSDGTEAGTFQVAALSFISSLVNVNGTAYFAASDDTHGIELWKSDGTVAGTVLVRDIVAGASGSSGLELWRSDGTPAGTTLVTTVEPGNEAPSAQLSASIPGAAVFGLWDTPSLLWRSDGTPAGTYSLLEPVFVPNDSSPSYITDVNGTILFAATDADHGRELWRSDGTPGGTVLVKDIEPGPDHSSPSQFFVTPSLVYFTATTSATGFEVYRTDGTEAGTFPIKDVQVSPDWQTAFGLVGDVLVFAADDGVHGLELWRTDGTADGTFLLGDLRPGAESSTLNAVGMLSGRLYFSASDGTTTALWRTDGTAAGTTSVASIPTFYMAGTELGAALFFSVWTSKSGPELWRTDGTAAGTERFLDINPTGSSDPVIIGRLENRLVLRANDGTHGSEPWITDGTVAGTELLKDINPGTGSSGFGAFTFLGSTLLFFAHDGVHGFEPWKTDGTTAGTVLVRDVVAGPAGSYAWSAFSAMGHEALFTASDHVSGREFWRTDGTDAGTNRVADLNPGIASGVPHWYIGAGRMPPVRSGGRMFFAATDGTTGHELWSLPIPLGFHPVTPCRFADTRDPGGIAGGVPLANAQTLILPVAGHCGIPSTAISVAANITIVNPTATGSLSVFAGGPIVSGSTEVPVTVGKTRAMNAIPLLGTTGSLSVRASLPEGGTTHVLLDVSGYFE